MKKILSLVITLMILSVGASFADTKPLEEYYPSITIDNVTIIDMMSDLDPKEVSPDYQPLSTDIIESEKRKISNATYVNGEMNAYSIDPTSSSQIRAAGIGDNEVSMNVITSDSDRFKVKFINAGFDPVDLVTVHVRVHDSNGLASFNGILKAKNLWPGFHQTESVYSKNWSYAITSDFIVTDGGVTVTDPSSKTWYPN